MIRQWVVGLSLMIPEIRKEEPKDYKATEQVVFEAFKEAPMSDGDEYNLVNRLRKSDEFISELSLVAEIDQKIIGHIILTKIKIDEFDSLALAPVSVLPEFQGQGIGAQLIKKSHEIAKSLGYKSIILLGHPEYYPRFGYKKASDWNIKAPFDVPDEAFLALELVEAGLTGVSGLVKYSPAFGIN